MLAFGICLPVPAFAATGLSFPLPAVVERTRPEPKLLAPTA